MSLKVVGCTVYSVNGNWIAILTSNGLVFYMEKAAVRKMYCDELVEGQVIWVYYDEEDHKVQSIFEKDDDMPKLEVCPFCKNAVDNHSAQCQFGFIPEAIDIKRNEIKRKEDNVRKMNVNKQVVGLKR